MKASSRERRPAITNGRKEELKGHVLWQTALIELEVGADDDHRAT